MRHMLAAMLVLLIGAGCSGLSLPILGPAPQPTTTRRTSAPTLPPPATATPATLAPTPSVAPTATAQPEPDDVRRPSVRAFARHLLASSRDLKRLGRKISREAEVRDVPGVKRAVAEASEWVAGELRWLAANQPRDCYRSLHDTWSRAMDKMSEALGVVANALESENQAEGWRGVRLLNESMAILDAYDAPPPDCRR
jgi:hypothetical protein